MRTLAEQSAAPPENASTSERSSLGLGARERALLRQARRLIGPRLGRLVAPSDLFQDTMLIAVTQSAKISQMPPGRAMAWLKGTMRFRLMRCLRDARAELDATESQSGAPPHPPAKSTSLLSRLAREELRAVLLARIDELKEPERQVLHWIYADRLEIAEIAKRLDRPKSAVRAIQWRGIQSLRRRLLEGGPP